MKKIVKIYDTGFIGNTSCKRLEKVDNNEVYHFNSYSTGSCDINKQKKKDWK